MTLDKTPKEADVLERSSLFQSIGAIDVDGRGETIRLIEVWGWSLHIAALEPSVFCLRALK